MFYCLCTLFSLALALLVPLHIDRIVCIIHSPVHLLIHPFLILYSLTRQQWYTNQINMICTWLTERVDCSLHAVQLSALSQIVKVSFLSPLSSCNLLLTVTFAIIALSLSPFHWRLSNAHSPKVHIALSDTMSHEILKCEEKCLIHLLFHTHCYFSLFLFQSFYLLPVLFPLLLPSHAIVVSSHLLAENLL